MEGYFAKADEISKNMHIPKSFLMKILKKLEKAGLVQLKRGVTGGIRLKKKPVELSLYDIIVAMENKVVLNRCVNNKKICSLVSKCPIHPVWFKIRDRFIESLKEITFEELSVKGAAL